MSTLSASRDTLAGILDVNSIVQVTQRSVSRSGMTRKLSLAVIATDEHDGKPYLRDITRLAADVAGFKLDRDGYLTVTGCGMDMHFFTVYNLSASLWPEGHPCTGSDERPNRCPSNDHSNGSRDYGSNVVHRDGGYALSYRTV